MDPAPSKRLELPGNGCWTYRLIVEEFVSGTVGFLTPVVNVNISARRDAVGSQAG